MFSFYCAVPKCDKLVVLQWKSCLSANPVWKSCHGSSLTVSKQGLNVSIQVNSLNATNFMVVLTFLTRISLSFAKVIHCKDFSHSVRRVSFSAQHRTALTSNWSVVYGSCSLDLVLRYTWRELFYGTAINFPYVGCISYAIRHIQYFYHLNYRKEQPFNYMKPFQVIQHVRLFCFCTAISLIYLDVSLSSITALIKFQNAPHFFRWIKGSHMSTVFWI